MFVFYYVPIVQKAVSYLNLAFILHRDIREAARQSALGFNFIAAQQPWAETYLAGCRKFRLH